MRRLVAILSLVVMFALLGSSLTAFAEDYSHGVKFIVDPESGVNIRDKDKKVVGYARGGSAVTVVGETKDWYKIKRSDGSDGYIFKKYLHVAHAEELEALDRAKRVGVKIDVNNSLARFLGVANNDIKVYKEDLKTKMGTIKAGEVIYIRQTGKYWYRVVYANSKIGYIQTKSGFTMTGPNIPVEGTPMLLNVPEGNYAYLLTEPKGGKTIAKFNSSSPTEAFIVLEVSGGWAKVAYNDKGDIGYIGKRFLKSTKMFNNE